MALPRNFKGPVDNTAENITPWIGVDKVVTTATIAQPYAYSNYTIYVRGNGTYLAGLQKSVSIRTKKKSRIVDLVQNVTDSSVSVSWSLVPYCEVESITHYKIHIETKTNECVAELKNSTEITYSNNTLAVLNYLTPFTVYNMQIRPVTLTGTNFWSESITFRTLEQQLGVVAEMNLQENKNKSNVLVQWSPPEDFGCQLLFYYVQYKLFSVGQCPSSAVPMSGCITIYNTSVKIPLHYFSKYSVSVQARWSSLLGRILQRNFTTTQAAPSVPPANINVFKQSNTSFTLEWKAPACQQRNGIINGYNWQLKENRRNEEQIATYYISSEGTDPDIEIYRVKPDFDLLPQRNYSVRVRAIVTKLEGPWSDWRTVLLYIENVAATEEISGVSDTALGGIIGGVGLLLLVVILVVVLNIMVKKRRHAQERNYTRTSQDMIMSDLSTENAHHYEGLCLQNSTVQESSSTDINNCIDKGISVSSDCTKCSTSPLYWQIPWSALLLGNVIGKGSFGEVRKAEVVKDGKNVEVAVKMLPGSVTDKDKTDFIGELNILSQLGQHSNVIALVGACLHEEVLYVTIEYASNGDLRAFLRKSRILEQTHHNNVFVAVSSLDEHQLLQFAYDVAKGMKYLAKHKVIHRDLAARNILVSENMVAKISDFGLSRNEEIYIKQTQTRIPVRWLAPEALFDCTYTSKSDVWSFGILLWEIVTLGGTPYSCVDTKSLYAMLKSGYRMSKPVNCSDDVYDVMHQCWNESPSRRHSFNVLTSILEDMLHLRKTYLNMKYNDEFLYENVVLSRDDK